MQKPSNDFHWKKIIGVAFVLMLTQVVGVLIFNEGKFPEFIKWDAAWYLNIATEGYQVRLPFEVNSQSQTNIAYFPGFPLWAALFIHGLGFAPLTGFLLSCFLAAWGFWFYFLLLMRKLSVSWGMALGTCVAMLLMPGSFYLVSGYSEAVFTLNLLGMIYWTHCLQPDSPSSRMSSMQKALVIGLIIFHSGWMAATRLIGVPLVIYPLFVVWFQKNRKIHSLLLPLGISIISLWGFWGFLYYCHLKFGHWDLYWQAIRAGWNVVSDAAVLFCWEFITTRLIQGNFPEIVGRIETLGLAFLMYVYWKKKGSKAFLPLFIFSLYYFLETVIASRGLFAMIRYLVPVCAVFFPLVAASLTAREIENYLKTSPQGVFLWALFIFLLIFIQACFVNRFSNGVWVA